MTGRGPLHGTLMGNPLLVGAVTLLLGGIAVILSYNANRGLPFVPTYKLSVDVPDAAEMTAGDDVRINGTRVGQVLRIRAMPGRGARPPFARLDVALDANQPQLPADSLSRIRPRSVLGAKYLEVFPGRSRERVPPGGVLPVRQALHAVEIDESFNVFDRPTTQGLRRTFTELGDVLTGRGTSFNQAVASTRRLLPPLQRLLELLASPSTDLEGFVRGLAQATDALAPVAATLGSMIGHGADTLRALEQAGERLEQAIEELPPTEVAGTRALRTIGPVLSDGAAIARAIRPGTRVLPAASLDLAGAVDTGTPVLRRAPALAVPLGEALAALDELALNPSTRRALHRLIITVEEVRDTLRYVNPAQTQCNIVGIWTRNVPSSVSQGDELGSWFNTVVIFSSTQVLQARRPAPDLHVTLYPHMNEAECEAGNEPFPPGQVIGNPPGRQSNNTQDTEPPPGARDRARRAGLLEPTEGAHR